MINVDGDGRGGREQLSALLLEALQIIEDNTLDVLCLQHERNPVSFLERLSGRIDGISSFVERQLLQRLSEDSPKRVIIDGSNLGRLARLIKRADPSLPVITFYHNVESRFFFDAFRAAPSLHAAGVLAANTLVERWATRFSEQRIVLNERDGRLLKRLYGRGATDFLPLAVRDFYDPAAAEEPCPLSEPYALFVGGAFYANIEGMAWYAKEVAPQSPVRTIVIGRGMEPHKARLENWGGVTVIGEVSDLAPWYRNAQIVVAPILSGSGMKTKTAEALMHGKCIAGTPEAFEGYGLLTSTDNLKVCVSATDFLNALRAVSEAQPEFSWALRNIYEQRHSLKALTDNLRYALSRNAAGDFAT